MRTFVGVAAAQPTNGQGRYHFTYNVRMSKQDPKEQDPNEQEPKKYDDTPSKPPSEAKHSRAIADASDEDDPEPDKARDRQPKAEDAKEAQRTTKNNAEHD